ATSMGTSEEALLGNTNAFAVQVPLNLSYAATLTVAAGPLESSTATYSFNVTNNGAGILPGGPNTFTFPCNACGFNTVVNPVAVPANPVMVMVPAMVGANPGFARIRIDPLVSGTAESTEVPVPEPSPGLLLGSGALLLFVSRRLPIFHR